MTDSLTSKQIHWHMDRQQTDLIIKRQKDRQTDRQTERQMDGQTD